MSRLVHSIARFDGRILQRGFWLYVWIITHEEQEFLYVGRTGDSSSQFASSPFSRIGQHLDLRSNAKGNSLLRNIRRENLDPMACTFELFAVGPLFEEQPKFISLDNLVKESLLSNDVTGLDLSSADLQEIGRASCRERVLASV